MNVKEAHESYLIRQANAGFKVGDMVRIVRRAESQEDGWNNGWVSPYMDDFIGHTYKIEKITGVGISVDNDKYHGLSFPYFILEKVE